MCTGEFGAEEGRVFIGSFATLNQSAERISGLLEASVFKRDVGGESELSPALEAFAEGEREGVA